MYSALICLDYRGNFIIIKTIRFLYFTCLHLCIREFDLLLLGLLQKKCNISSNL